MQRTLHFEETTIFLFFAEIPYFAEEYPFTTYELPKQGSIYTDL